MEWKLQLHRFSIIGLTTAGLMFCNLMLADSLKVGGGIQTDFAWFDDSVQHSDKRVGSRNLSFDNQSNVSVADLYFRGRLLNDFVYNLSVYNNLFDRNQFGLVEDESHHRRLTRMVGRRNGPSILDAWVGWDRFDPMARFSVGRMNVSQGLENTGNRSAYTFVSPAAGQRSFKVGRADGVTMEGNPTRWLGYQVGAFKHTTNANAVGAEQGQGANIDPSSQVVVSNDGNHLSMFSARAFVQPWVSSGRLLHLGGSYSYVGTRGDVSLNAAPGGYFNTSNSQLIRLSSARGPARVDNNFNPRTGGYVHWGAEGLWTWGPVHVQSEYSDFKLTLKNLAKDSSDTTGAQVLKDNFGTSVGDYINANGWYVQAGWVVTGEARHYDPVSGTLGKLSPRYKMGAVEVAGRYDRVNFDDTVNTTGLTIFPTSFCGDQASVSTNINSMGCTSGGRMSDWTLGLNWYPNRNVKLMANYTLAKARYAKTASGEGPDFTSQAHPHPIRNHAERKVDVFVVKGQVDF
ncbi:MAG: hypothetical protein KBD64_05315 [Gammaproteobacteria bacterium]|nr:hypothetical protein [Gammaproteobacteria bacterium]